MTFLNSLPRIGPDIGILVPSYAGDKFGGMWHGPTSRLGTGGTASGTFGAIFTEHK